MKTFDLLKIATSSLVLGSVLVGCGPAGERVASVSSKQEKKAADQAAKLSKKVRTALAKGEAATAVTNAEAMVSFMPQDATYRQLLGETYLAAGRFTSAETTLGDSLDLQPNNEKVALKLALVKAALGKQQPAQNLLRDYRDRLSATDYGLALALAGDVENAIPTLESVVRSPNADARARQNLALVYAMSNRWLEARTVAAQDLSPTLLSERITQWAGFVRPKGSWDQVASLLGVTPAYDVGQPIALALAPNRNSQGTLAAAEPAVDEQATIAAADPAPVINAATQASPAAAPVYEMAARKEVVQPIPVPLVKSPQRPIKTALAKPRVAPRQSVAIAAAKAAVRAPVKATPETGKFAVQLGAFDNASKANAAWTQAIGKVAALKGRQPSRTGVTVKSTNYVRLAVAGLNTRGEADQLCASVRASGASCFVRSAGNASLPVQFAKKAPAKGAPQVAAKAPVKPVVKLSSTQPVPKPIVKVAAKVAPKPVPKPTKVAVR
jgi:Flp pilus assembly protein TadD